MRLLSGARTRTEQHPRHSFKLCPFISTTLNFWCVKKNGNTLKVETWFLFDFQSVEPSSLLPILRLIQGRSRHLNVVFSEA